MNGSFIYTICTSTTIIVVAGVVSILFGIPHRDLEWNTTIVPLARKYSEHKQQQSIINTNTNSIQYRYPLIGTNIVITGATSGIGLSLTKALIQLGATVIALGRSSTKLQKIHDDCTKIIVQQQGQEQQLMNSSTDDSSIEIGGIHTFVIEMSDLISVGQVGKAITSKFDVIDILVNNAGMHGLDDMFAKNASVGSNPSYDRVFVVNYLSHFLLTEQLIPSLQNSNRPVIVQTSSSYHWAVDGSDLVPSVRTDTTANNKNEMMPIAAQPGGSVGFYLFRTQRSYANSKLAQIYHARALYQKIYNEQQQQQLISKDTSLLKWKHLPRIVSFCPGWVGTNIGGPNDSMPTKILATIAFPVHGWGIASALHAILTTSSNDDTTDNNDYYINSKAFLIANYLFPKPTPIWFYKYGFRDIISNMFANFALVTQRLGSYAGPSKSSPESYNQTNAKLLYDWSYHAVQQYM